MIDHLVACVWLIVLFIFFFFQAEDGIRDDLVTGVQTCALPISAPALTALPLPLPRCSITRMPGRSCCATSIVSSVECPSTRITSAIMAGIRGKTWGRFAASFRVGITTLMRGYSGLSMTPPDRVGDIGELGIRVSGTLGSEAFCTGAG